jgi:hypothetical protein
MDLYKPSADNEAQRLVLSSMQYGLLKWFYKKGESFMLSKEEALRLDQRSFGPAVARGLINMTRDGFYMSPAGRIFVERYETRSPLKQTISRSFSHYIQFNRSLQRRSR